MNFIRKNLDKINELDQSVSKLIKDNEFYEGEVVGYTQIGLRAWERIKTNNKNGLTVPHPRIRIRNAFGSTADILR